jgi:hypothetical protein
MILLFGTDVNPTLAMEVIEDKLKLGSQFQMLSVNLVITSGIFLCLFLGMFGTDRKMWMLVTVFKT